jgi:clan AA aspartic protease (TIGR02281 family)
MRRDILLFSLLFFFLLEMPCFGQMYRWVDEKGAVHFTDDLSRIPEKYRRDAESRGAVEETSTPQPSKKPVPPATGKASEVAGYEVDLIRRHELWLAEVTLNERVGRQLIVDTGASFTLINRQTADELGLLLDDSTPVIPGTTVSGTILTPMVTLKSVRVGQAMAENVEAVVHTMPGNQAGLLGNSFLNKFRVVLDSLGGRMTLFPLQGEASPDRPGGFGRDYWVGQFRFYHHTLAELKTMKTRYESQGARTEANRIAKAIQYFENQLNELERRASFAGVPRQWRE